MTRSAWSARIELYIFFRPVHPNQGQGAYE